MAVRDAVKLNLPRTWSSRYLFDPTLPQTWPTTKSLPFESLKVKSPGLNHLVKLLGRRLKAFPPTALQVSAFRRRRTLLELSRVLITSELHFELFQHLLRVSLGPDDLTRFANI